MTKSSENYKTTRLPLASKNYILKTTSVPLARPISRYEMTRLEMLEQRYNLCVDLDGYLLNKPNFE